MPPPSCGSTSEGGGTWPKRVILEMGTGNDLHGGDYTKAALRAVQDALHHSSLSLIRSFGLNSKPACRWRSRSACSSPTRSMRRR